MRLWHYKLIEKLPRQQLLGQHRECCALRGLGWGKKHATVDYVFKYKYCYLVSYHIFVMMEMKKRGYKPDHKWFTPSYRGVKLRYDNSEFTEMRGNFHRYKEHDDNYLNECLENLENKGIIIR